MCTREVSPSFPYIGRELPQDIRCGRDQTLRPTTFQLSGLLRNCPARYPLEDSSGVIRPMIWLVQLSVSDSYLTDCIFVLLSDFAYCL